MHTVVDPYTDCYRCLVRLRKEFADHGSLIIAVDFDDTVYDTHENGWEYTGVIDILKRWKDHSTIIVWSASNEDRYQKIRNHFEIHGIRIDKINENADGIEYRGPKIYANIYLDDRSCGLSYAIRVLNQLATENGF